jgi:methylated-DNA-[protein]-cysteine S-methyltransferase
MITAPTAPAQTAVAQVAALPPPRAPFGADAAALGTASVRRACTAQKRWRSPLGVLLLARTEHGLAGAWFEGQRHHPPALDAPEADAGDALLDGAIGQLERYFAGDRHPFGIPLDLHGSPFQRAVWNALLGIAAGSTKSYGDIASAIGRPAAVRAVGAAVGRNPVSILVPCHRVIGADGSLTGYAGGLQRKLALLQLEGWLPAGKTARLARPA